MRATYASAWLNRNAETTATTKSNSIKLPVSLSPITGYTAAFSVCRAFNSNSNATRNYAQGAETSLSCFSRWKRKKWRSFSRWQSEAMYYFLLSFSFRRRLTWLSDSIAFRGERCWWWNYAENLWNGIHSATKIQVYVPKLNACVGIYPIFDSIPCVQIHSR